MESAIYLPFREQTGLSALKKISILGSTGSIGRQTLDIVQAHSDRLKVVAIAAGQRNLALLTEQVRLFQPELVSVPDRSSKDELDTRLSAANLSARTVCGDDGLLEAATHKDVETVVTGLMGFRGVLPTAAAIRHGKTVALANKETLVAAGSVIMPMCKQYGATIIPVDSEHSAIFQSLSGYSIAAVDKILLTGSGGPFRTWSKEQMESATVADALRHPNWSMGKKITIDSATLMNKGLEIIEARWLFDVSADKVKVLIHPQSILHSAVEFCDGSIVGQMGLPDMRLPIHFALFYPERVESPKVPRLDFFKLAQLTFEEPDLDRFPCLALAQAAASESSTLPCVLNAANEVAVDSFLKAAIRFVDISKLIEQVMIRHKAVESPTLEDILAADRWARTACEELVGATA